MKTERFHVYFEDEARIIGSGWRPVEAKIGRKWVRVKANGALRGTKITRETWDKLRKDDRYEYKKPRTKKVIRLLHLS